MSDLSLALTTPLWVLGEAGDRVQLAPRGHEPGVACYVEREQASDAAERLGKRGPFRIHFGAIQAAAAAEGLALYIIGGTRIIYLSEDRREYLDLAQLIYRS